MPLTLELRQIIKLILCLLTYYLRKFNAMQNRAMITSINLFYMQFFVYDIIFIQG